MSKFKISLLYVYSFPAFVALWLIVKLNIRTSPHFEKMLKENDVQTIAAASVMILPVFAILAGIFWLDVLVFLYSFG